VLCSLSSSPRCKRNRRKPADTTSVRIRTARPAAPPLVEDIGTLAATAGFTAAGGAAGAFITYSAITNVALAAHPLMSLVWLAAAAPIGAVAIVTGGVIAGTLGHRALRSAPDASQ